MNKAGRSSHLTVLQRRALPLIGVAAVLAGCAPTLAPPELPADVAVPGAYQAAAMTGDQNGDGQTTQDNAPWLPTFQSAQLEAIVAEALANNYDLKSAAARMAQARARAAVANAGRLPSVDLDVAGSRRQIALGPQTIATETYSAGLSAQWEVDLWGRIASDVRSAELQAEGSAEDYAAARLSIAGAVAQGWVGLVSARQQLALAEATVQTYERSNTIVVSRYQRGLTTALDVRQAATQLASARALRTQRLQQMQEQARSLEVLLGRYPSALIAEGEQMATDLPGLPALPATGVPMDLLEQRPDLRAASARLASAGYDVASARRRLLPSISLNGSLGDQGDTLGRGLDFNSLLWSIAGQLTQPLFRAGAIREGLKQVEAVRDERVQNYAQTALTAFREVEDALAAERQLAARARDIADAARQAEAAGQLAERQYASGLTSLLNLLDSQRQALDSRGNLLDIQRQQLFNRISLHLALGGGLPPEDGLADGLADGPAPSSMQAAGPPPDPEQTSAL